MNFMKKIIESRISAHSTPVESAETDTGFDHANAPSNEPKTSSTQNLVPEVVEQEMAPIDSCIQDTTETGYEHSSVTSDGFEASDPDSNGLDISDSSRFEASNDTPRKALGVEQNIHFVSAALEMETSKADETPHVYSRRISTSSPSTDPTPHIMDEDQADIDSALLNKEVGNYLESINNTLQKAGENAGFASANNILSDKRRDNSNPLNATEKQVRSPLKQRDLGAEMGEHSISVAGRAVHRRTNRAKTRLLGFESVSDDSSDPFNATGAGANQAFVVGWIAVTEGPGRGNSFPLHTGVSQIGRGEDQAVRLNYGDNSISRSNHAAIAYDHEQNKFFLGHGGKANLVRLNSNPVLSTEELCNGDVVEIGETKLRFVAFCDTNFNWGPPANHSETAHV